jgi:hypothetical protein
MMDYCRGQNHGRKFYRKLGLIGGCSTICGGDGGNGLSPYTQNQWWTLSKAVHPVSNFTHTF